jgi:hypothetical protein
MISIRRGFVAFFFSYSVTCGKSFGQATSIPYLADSMKFVEHQCRCRSSSVIGDSRIVVGHSVDVVALNALTNDTIEILIQ